MQLNLKSNWNILNHFDNWKHNPGDLWHLRHWLQFWQLRTWIHDNLCYLTINCDTGQHSQFLRCFLSLSPFHFYFPFILILTLPFFTFSVLIFNFTSQCSLSLSCSYFHFLIFTLSGSTSWQNTSDKKPFCTLVLDRKPSVSKSRKTQICQKKSLRICGEKFYKLSSRLNKCQIAFILTSKYVPTIPENLRIVK